MTKHILSSFLPGVFARKSGQRTAPARPADAKRARFDAEIQKGVDAAAEGKVNANRIPFNAVIAVAVLAMIITLPALKGNKDGLTVAFTAVVSIGVIGLYIAYVIPIYLRWRQGDAFKPGPWTLGSKYKWMNPIAVLEVIIVVVIYFNLPFSSGGVPWESDFEWSLFNYTPVVTGGLALAITIWWQVSAKTWFTGPKHTIAELDAEIGAPPPFPEAP